MISVPNHPKLTLAKAFELLRELDHYAGHKSGAGSNAIACVDKTRAALASHIEESLARKDKRK
jgi:hypothetical protein